MYVGWEDKARDKRPMVTWETAFVKGGFVRCGSQDGLGFALVRTIPKFGGLPQPQLLSHSRIRVVGEFCLPCSLGHQLDGSFTLNGHMGSER